MSFDWRRLEREDREKLATRSAVTSAVLVVLAVVCGVMFAVDGRPKWLIAGLVWLAMGGVGLLVELRRRRRGGPA